MCIQKYFMLDYSIYMSELNKNFINEQWSKAETRIFPYCYQCQTQWYMSVQRLYYKLHGIGTFLFMWMGRGTRIFSFCQRGDWIFFTFVRGGDQISFTKVKGGAGKKIAIAHQRQTVPSPPKNDTFLKCMDFSQSCPFIYAFYSMKYHRIPHCKYIYPIDLSYIH